MLGVPVKSYGWISEFSNNGQWFEGGCIVWNGSEWLVKVGNWGQTAGRLADNDIPFKINAEIKDAPLPEPEDKPAPPEHA